MKREWRSLEISFLGLFYIYASSNDNRVEQKFKFGGSIFYFFKKKERKEKQYM
jgi:hypothetical protein